MGEPAGGVVSGTEATAADPGRSIAPLIGVLVGVPIAAFGLWSALTVHSARPIEIFGWAIGSNLVHDLIWAPVMCLIAWGVGQVLPPVTRFPVRWAIGTTAVLWLIAWPFVRGYGRNPAVPSLLNRNYGWGLGVYVGVVWIIAAAWIMISVMRARRR